MKGLTDGCILTSPLGSQASSRLSRCGGWQWTWTPGSLQCFFLVPVALASLSLLQEGPYQGVYNVRLVLLQPVACPGDDVETEVVADVEAARFGHLLLQEGVPLPPQQQHRRADVVLAQREGAVGKNGIFNAFSWLIFLKKDSNGRQKLASWHMKAKSVFSAMKLVKKNLQDTYSGIWPDQSLSSQYQFFTAHNRKSFLLPKTSLTFTNDVHSSNILPVMSLTVALRLEVPSCFLWLFRAICGDYLHQRNADWLVSI